MWNFAQSFQFTFRSIDPNESTRQMKILIDENMPYAEALFSQLGEVTMKSGRTLTADDLVDVDALMIRSVTKVNESLISKANKLKFVGTATAGMDHVDQELMKERGIFFTAAPGCNKMHRKTNHHTHCIGSKKQKG